jgi:hypothetical protein
MFSLPLSAWLILLNIMFSKFIYIVTKDRVFWFFKGWLVFHCYCLGVEYSPDIHVLNNTERGQNLLEVRLSWEVLLSLREYPSSNSISFLSHEVSSFALPWILSWCAMLFEVKVTKTLDCDLKLSKPGVKMHLSLLKLNVSDILLQWRKSNRSILCVLTKFLKYIHPLMVTLIISTSWLLWIMLQWTWKIQSSS